MNSLIHRLSAWERMVTGRLIPSKRSRWRWLLSLGAHLGDGVLWVAVGAVLLVWGTPYLRGSTLITSLAVLGATAVSTAIKYLVRRPRPQELTRFYVVRFDRYSFPSGHAARMAAIAVLVGHFEPRLAPIGYPLALTVALCRVVVGVHYPSDVLAGLLIGLLGAWGMLLWI